MSTPEPALRTRILSTATSLFIQHGYHGLAMRQIAEALHVSKPALYYHFKDKEELFLAILTMYLDEMEKAIDRIMAEPVASREKVRDFMEYVLAQPPDQRAIIHLASQEVRQLSDPVRKSFGQIYQKKFIGKIEDILKAGMQRGEFRPIEAPVATWTLLGIMYPYFYPARAGNGDLSEETIRQIITVYLDGIITSSSKNTVE
jgi:AcrR family transcriptional regulator